jgi:micrococcal nuclease
LTSWCSVVIYVLNARNPAGMMGVKSCMMHCDGLPSGFLLLVPCFLGEGFSGRVVGVSDGDTISVTRGGVAVKVRLRGIDAPEKGQPFSNRAKQFVSSLVFGQTVTVNGRGVDRYGRTIADVLLSDGRNLNHE